MNSIHQDMTIIESDDAKGGHPFLSVLLPVYNGEEFLPCAIESVLTQPCRDLELLILDDGSTDTTEAISLFYAAQDERVRYFRHPNYGLGRNRNIGIPYLKGRIVIFLDHDDLLLPHFYTDGFVAFAESCLAHGVETIVPARVMCDERAERGYLDKNRKEGIFKGSEASWWVEHEFASLVYSNNLIQRYGLVFSETKPEMETIFRHKAVLYSERVLFTNSFYFSVRRSSGGQITKNWNRFATAKVRLSEYKLLIEQELAESVPPSVQRGAFVQLRLAADELYSRAAVLRDPSSSHAIGEARETWLSFVEATTLLEKIALGAPSGFVPAAAKLLDASSFLRQLPRRIRKLVRKSFCTQDMKHFEGECQRSFPEVYKELRCHIRKEGEIA